MLKRPSFKANSTSLNAVGKTEYIYIFYISPLYEITDNCYGLCNAPATWYFKVDNDDPLSASFTCHSLERATAAGLCPDRPRG